MIDTKQIKRKLEKAVLEEGDVSILLDKLHEIEDRFDGLADLLVEEVKKKLSHEVPLLKGKDGEDGQDGISPEPEEVAKIVLSKIKIPKPRDGVGKKGDKGEPGKDADPEKVAEIVLKKIEVPQAEVNLEEIAEYLRKNKSLDISHIRNNGMFKTKHHGYMDLRLHGGGTVATQFVPYDLTGQCNGVNKTFTVPKNLTVLSIFSTQFPINYRPVVDWTRISDTQITLTSEVSAPESGQTLYALLITA